MKKACSVLGPLLFVMYIHELPQIACFCSIAIDLYADDTLLYFGNNGVKTIETHLTADLENIVNWLHANRLVLNITQTKIMLAGTYQRLATIENFSVKTGTTDLEREEKFK